MSLKENDQYNETLHEAMEELGEDGRDEILTFMFGDLNND